MKPRDFRTLAFTLVGNNDEADLRSAISRGYYAAFHVASDFFTALGFRVPNAEQAHAYLRLRLSNCGDPHVVRGRRRLNRLRQQRNLADYDLRHPVSSASALSEVREGGKIIDLLDALIPGPRLTQIRDTMIVYERDVLKDVTWHP
jgi:uncharacterized protein (UPF0332 family)